MKMMAKSARSVRRSTRRVYEILCRHFLFDDDFFLGTFAPACRASERPMAMACFRLVTFLPERPLFSVPRFRSCIARSTFFEAFLLYLRAIRQFSFHSGVCKARARVIPSVSEGSVWACGATNMFRAPPVHTDPSLTLGMTRRATWHHHRGRSDDPVAAR